MNEAHADTAIVQGGKSALLKIRLGEVTYRATIHLGNSYDRGLKIKHAHESAVALLLLPAMKLGLPLRVEENISHRFSLGVDRLQDIYSLWWDDLNRIPIHANTRDQTEDATREALFFSGGVDSLCSALRHPNAELIYIDWTGRKSRPIDVRAAHGAATAIGRELLVISTNMRRVVQPYVKWGIQAHGAVLAAIALSLQGTYRRVFIASSHSYADLFPWGSHVLTDNLWSTESTEIIHDGAELTRVEKMRLVAFNDAALKHLRVCQMAHSTQVNCGRCEKCIRTAINLVAIDKLQLCQTLPSTIDLKVLGSLKLDQNTRSFMKENLSACRAASALSGGRSTTRRIETQMAFVLSPPLRSRVRRAAARRFARFVARLKGASRSRTMLVG